MANVAELLAVLDLVYAREWGGSSFTRNPTERRALVKHEEVEDHRSLSCAEYDICIDVALRRGWESWTCCRCELFHLRRELQVAELAHDAALRPLS
jgi:hypothetical protein